MNWEIRALRISLRSTSSPVEDTSTNSNAFAVIWNCGQRHGRQVMPSSTICMPPWGLHSNSPLPACATLLTFGRLISIFPILRQKTTSEFGNERVIGISDWTQTPFAARVSSVLVFPRSCDFAMEKNASTNLLRLADRVHQDDLKRTCTAGHSNEANNEQVSRFDFRPIFPYHPV